MSFAIVIYTVIFYFVWALIELVVYPALTPIATAETAEIIKEVLIKNVLWTIPALLLIKKYEANIKISLKEMFTSKVNWFKMMSKPDELASEKFWKLDRKIKSDKKKTGVLMELDKSEMEVDIARLVKDNVITFDDLLDFSPELQKNVRLYYDRFYGK